MKKLALLLIAISIIACGNKQNDLTVKAQIKGLQKGTVYLKKIEDTTLVTVDSIAINGQTNIELYSALDTPEVFYLYLDKNSLKKDAIAFFADKGVTEINTTLKNFIFDAEIKGSEQQKIWEKYQKYISITNNRNLDLIKESFEARKTGDTSKLKAIEKEQNNAIKRKYLYTVNFALNNKDSEVAPYLALSEIYNAKLELLDTINKSLTPKVKASKYGVQLDEYLKSIEQ